MKTTTAYNNLFSMNARIFARTLALAVSFTVAPSPSMAATPMGQSFGSPREAVAALQRAADATSLTELRKIFGPKLDEIANPDRVQATNETAMFAAALRETNRLIAIAERRMAIEYGPDATLFPVPLVENAGRW